MRPLVFERVVIDGIPAYIGNDTGPITAGLVFRAGTADEEPLERGITALVAELAAIEADASFEVDEAVTSIIVSGNAKDVSAALDTACTTLSDLDADDLADLADSVLGSARVSSLAADLMSLRFGTRSYGTASLPPLFCFHPTAAAAKEWVLQWFTRGNAMVWSTGPLTADATLPLGGGARRDAPGTPASIISTPAWTVLEQPLVSAHAVVAPSAATTVTLRAIASEIRERAGDAHLDDASLECRLTSWSADAARVTIQLRAPANTNDYIELVLGTIDDFAESGPDPDELTEAITNVEEWAMRRENAAEVGALLCRNELLSGRTRTLDDYLADIGAVSGGQVAQAAGAIRDALLVAVPDDGEIIDERFTEVGPVIAEPLDGNRYASTSAESLPGAPDTLVVGSEGVSMTLYDVTMTVRYDDCVAAVRYVDDAVSLYGADGTAIDVAARDWVDGLAAISAIESAVPGDRIARTETLLHAGRSDDDAEL